MYKNNSKATEERLKATARWMREVFPKTFEDIEERGRKEDPKKV